MSDETFARLLTAVCLLALVVVGLDIWYWRP